MCDVPSLEPKMSRSVLILFAMLAAPLGACLPTVTATPEGQQVKLMKGDPPAGCEELRDVDGEDTGFVESGANQESAKARLRNAAASIGANYVRMETVEKAGNTVRFHGTAYRCPAARVPATPPAASAAK